MNAFYNDNDPKACAWLRELIKSDLIAPGIVDERDINEIDPDELKEYTQCHFFAGIGGWSYALRLAGWPDEAPVWTGSCPCQPLSCAGKRQGHADERHLWPAFHRLIAERRPSVCFGEQVASTDGREWLAGIRADLEDLGYAVGVADLCAASVGAPHRRQRLFWVANLCRAGLEERQVQSTREECETTERSGQPCLMANTEHNVRWTDQPWRRPEGRETDGRTCRVDDTLPNGCEVRQPIYREHDRERFGERCDSGWSQSTTILCRDGKLRRIPLEPIFQLESDGLSCILGDGWNSILSQVEETITTYAKKINTGPGEVLRAMWEAVAKESLRENFGGHDTVQVQKVLLLALCELTRNPKHVIHATTQTVSTIQEATLRIVRGCPAKIPTSCPPHQQELEGSSTGESSNALHQVSLADRTSEKAGDTMQGMRKEVTKAFNVSEALSAVEEVWKSFDDKGQRLRDSERIQAGLRIIEATNCFPLAPRIPRRVGLLRGAGNAIVPQVAAKFIQAAREALNQLQPITP